MLLMMTLACSPWSFPDRGTKYFDEAPWDPEVVAAVDGVYVRLPLAGELVRVTREGWSQVDLDGARPDRLVLAPDGETLLVFASWPVCEDDDPDVVYLSDCREEDLVEEHELDIVRDGERVAEGVDVPPEFNAVSFSDDGTRAVAWLDFSEDTDVEVGTVLNVTEAVFIDLTSTDPETMTRSVPIGIAAETILFTEDDQALVLSRSEVALVDLDDGSVVTFPLTLDEGSEVQPDDVELVSHDDGTGELIDYALVTVQGESDLYVIDLTEGRQHIDVVDLRGVPSDLLVMDVTDEATGEVTDQTIIVYGSLPQADLMEHETFEVTPIELSEPETRAVEAAGGALLYNDAGRYHRVTLLDPGLKGTQDWVAENPIVDLWLTSDGTRAVATFDTESGGDFYDQYYGLGIFDLTDEGEVSSLALSGAPLGVAIVESEGEANALLLLDGVDKLLQVDLTDGSSSDDLDLEEPPLGIAAQPGGDFVVTHAAAAGLLSFVDPSNPEDIQVVAGFATSGLLEDPRLPRRNVE